MYFDAKATGERIRQLRLSRKMTQEELANRLHISVDHYGKLELAKPKHGISLDLLIDFSDFFDVSLDFLILGRDHQSDSAKEKLSEIIVELEALKKQL